MLHLSLLNAKLIILIVIGVVVCTSTVPINHRSLSAGQSISGNRPFGGQTGLIFIVKLDTIRFMKTEGTRVTVHKSQC